MRYERVEDILRLALIMQASYQGLSLQDIQDEFEVSRRTAIRMKNKKLFPYMQHGRVLLFKPDEVLDGLSKHKRK